MVMNIITTFLPVETEGNGDVVDLTGEAQDSITTCGIKNGTAIIFSPSATSGITTLEYEPGCVKDLKRLFDEIIPVEKNYHHNERWGDGNGHSHTRAALLKPSLTIPIVNGKMTLGRWQSIVLVDFDNRPRSRRLVLQIMGE
jgi:secondary thiamine-phosphate synthase enzyme